MPSKVAYFSLIADIFSTTNRPKTSPNIKFCSMIKMAHQATYSKWLWQEQEEEEKKLLICTTAAVLHTPALRFAPGFFTVVRISPFCLIADQGCLKEIFDCFFKSAIGQTKPPLVHCGCTTRYHPRFFLSSFASNHLLMHGWK